MSTPDLTRERLLESAGQAFAEEGFESATVRSICGQAGVNLAAVNYHFGDKERLYVEAVKRAHECRMSEIPLPHWPPGTPAAERLRDFVGMLVARMLPAEVRTWHTQLLLREVLQPTPACMEMVREFVRPYFQILMTILDELLPAATPELNRHLIAFSIVGQCLHYRVAQPFIALLVPGAEAASYQADLLKKHITDFTLAAVRQLGEEGPEGAKSKTGKILGDTNGVGAGGRL